MLEMKVVEPIETEWAAPSMYVPKKDGSLRFFVGYAKVNVRKERESYHIFRMGKCFDSLANALIFCTLNASRGNWQVEIEDVDCHKTAFTSHQKLYRISCMSFGLHNALGTI